MSRAQYGVPHDPYALDPDGCQASVSFGKAPWITVQCTLPPDHSEPLHRASVHAPNRGARNADELMAGRSHSRVWLSWRQDVGFVSGSDVGEGG